MYGSIISIDIIQILLDATGKIQILLNATKWFSMVEYYR